MRTEERSYLSMAYQYYLDTGKRECGFRFTNNEDKSKTYTALDNLSDDGYIQYTAQASGFCQFKITPKGIQFAENNYQESELPFIVQGANSILVNGSGNTVSNNYSQISLDIAKSDLPNDCKQLIESFLQEIKSPNLSPEKKSHKIKSFLSDISSGTISGVAASGLATLLSALLSQINF